MISRLSRLTPLLSFGNRWAMASLMFIFALMAYPSCDPGKQTGTPKSKTEDDEKREEGVRAETEFRKDLPEKEIKSVDQLKIPNTPAGQAIMVHFEAAYAMGEGAEKQYEESLRRLRESSGEVVEILSKAYGEVDQDMYADRWLILQTLADMKVDEALPMLIRSASADLPQRDTNQYDHNVSAYQEESILRITAIRGIADLAAKNDRAAEAMPRFFQHKDPTIRLEALNSFADAVRTIKDRVRVSQLLKFFPEDYKFELKPVNPGPLGIEGEDPKLQPKGQGNGEAPIKK